MHYCGNPFHDIPQWLVFVIPALAPAWLWIKIRFNIRRKIHDHES